MGSTAIAYSLKLRWMLQQETVTFTCYNIYMTSMQHHGRD
ncbi:hypothetical protein L914_19830, partial [Phytophthora nicotianae]